MRLDAEDRVVLGRLGETVRALRHERGLSQAVLAGNSGLSRRFIAQLEAGEGNISYLRLRRVARALGTALPTLIQNAETGGGRVVSLLGLRGAGKSTVGRALARKLGVAFVELDERVEAEAGMPMAQIFELQGARYFRRLEREVLERLLDEATPAVLATGGGIVTEPQTLELLLRRTRTVWLRAPAEEHWRRVVAQGDLRPMAGRAEAMEELRGLWRSRATLYARAETTIATGGRSVEALAEALAGVFRT